MKISVVAASCLCLLASSSAFVPMQQRASVRPVRMVNDEEAGALVPIKEETVEFAAGVVGGLAGFTIGGPVLGAIFAAAGNYVSKMEGDVPDVVQAVSKSSIQVFNYLSKIDKKYEVLSKAQDSLESALDDLKSKGKVDTSVVEKVETALASTTSKLNELNDEYDLVGGGMTALGVVGDLVEKAVQKAGELNEEYALSDKALGSLNKAVDTAKSKAGN